MNKYFSLYKGLLLVTLLFSSCTALIMLDYTGYQDKDTIPKQMYDSELWTYGVLYLAFNENDSTKSPVYSFYITPPVYIGNTKDSIDAISALNTWANKEFPSNNQIIFSRVQWYLFTRKLTSYFSVLNRSYKLKGSIDWAASNKPEVGVLVGYSFDPNDYDLKPNLNDATPFIIIDGGSSANVGLTVKDGKFIEYSEIKK